MKKKNKLNNLTDLSNLKKYLIKIVKTIPTSTIQFSSDFEFTYFNLNEIDYEKIKVRPENIFKLNLNLIIKILQKYFPDTIFEINFEAPGENDLIIKKTNCTFKHDTYIKVISKDNDDYYDIGLEYFETVHDRIKDNDKDISSKLNLGSYYIYKEETHDYNNFMKEVIYNIMIGACALNDDPYTLSKINYFKNYKHIKSLKTDTQLFSNIINWKKFNKLNLNKLFDELLLINPETGIKFKFNDFLEYMNDNDINIEFINDNYDCEYKYLVEIIIKINSECSRRLTTYKTIYTRTMDILFNSQKELIEWIKKTNNIKKLIPDYLESFLRNHIQNYRRKHTQLKVFENLKEKLKLK